MAPEFTNNEEKYLFHLEEFKKFSGSATEYCKLHSLRPDMLSYYKKKIQSRSKPAERFAKVKVDPSADIRKSPSLKPVMNIDPEWLATFTHNLLNR